MDRGDQLPPPAFNMTLTTAVAPLVAYAVFFQTAVYLALPAPLRTRWAPIFVGLVGSGVAVAAGILFGFGTIGLKPSDPLIALVWGLGAVVTTSIVGAVMLSRSSLRSGLADPRLASLTKAQAFVQIFLRIPVFTALIEELFFRGVLHAALMALYPMPVAIWLGAGLFGIWHIGPGLDRAESADKENGARVVHTVTTVIGTTIAGVFLVWLRVETGSIWAPVAVHAAMNMTMAVFARSAGARQQGARPGVPHDA